MPSARRLLWLWVLPLAIGLVATWPTLGNEFTNDDRVLIVDNALLREEGRFWKTLTEDYFNRASGVELGTIGYWRPVVKTAYWLEYRMFGNNPARYHAVAILLFLGSIGLGYRLARELGLGPAGSALALSFYAAHPSHAETLGIVTCLSDLLVAIGCIGCFWAYVRWRRTDLGRWLALALAFQCIALGSKELGALLPGLLLLWEWQEPRAESKASRWKRWSTFLVPPVLYALARAALGILPVSSAAGTPLSAPIASGGKLLVGGLLRALVPTLWSPYLHQDRPGGGMGPLFFWTACAAACIAATAFLSLRFPKLRPALCLLWFPLVLPVSAQAMISVSPDPRALLLADRWLGIAALGAGIAWAHALLGAARRRPGRSLQVFGGALAAAAIGHLVVATRAESRSFRTEAARLIFEGSALRGRSDLSARDRERMLRGEAARALEEGRFEESAAAYAELVALEPTDYFLHYNLALASVRAGLLDQALHHGWIAFYGTTPDGATTYPPNDFLYRSRPARAFLLGWILERRGDVAGARKHYRLALELNPTFVQAQAALARLPGPRGG